jgi:hypothetical protein
LQHWNQIEKSERLAKGHDSAPVASQHWMGRWKAQMLPQDLRESDLEE